MLTPGTSQDNIRGFFYRGNVNLGAGTREYSNGFVVDGVNNTWAEMGEPRQNFAMDAIQEFKVSTSTYKAEYGLATGGLLTVVTKSGTNQLHGSGLLFFRDASITAKEFFQTDQARLPPLSVRRHDRRPDRAEPDAFLRRLRGDEREPVLHGQRARACGRSTRARSRASRIAGRTTSRSNHQLTPDQSLFFRYGAEDEYRPIITTGGRTTPSTSFDFAVPRESAVVGHTGC